MPFRSTRAARYRTALFMMKRQLKCQAYGTRVRDNVLVRWMHRVRLYPSTRQEARLRVALDVTRQIYNAALEQRRDMWTSRRKAISSKSQYAEITALRAEDARIAGCYRECEDAALHRLDLAFAAFFRRLKAGEIAGYPRFRSAARWKQLEFPHGDRALGLTEAQNHVRIPMVGSVRLRKGRVIPPYGRAFVVERTGRWYAVFECQRDLAPLAPTGRAVGIDRGIRALVATSEGELFENPRHAERRKTVVTRHQRQLDDLTVKDAAGRVSNGRDPARRAAVRRLARAKEREGNARRDALHKVSRELVDRYDVIAVEDLRLRAMTRSAKGTLEHPGRGVRAKAGLNRALLDAGLSMLVTLIREKAANTARVVVSVDARYTSQTCVACGHVAAASRVGDLFVCLRCGHRDDADVNAARCILFRAQSALTSGPHAGAEPARHAGRVA
jgi:putative transposase